MAAWWSLLQPWLEALTSRLISQEFPHPCLRLDIKCRPPSLAVEYLDRDARVVNGSIFLIFFSDDQNRQDTARLQRIREGMELLNMLAMVDNSAFVDMMSTFTVLDRPDDDGGPYLVCPVWKCRLLGTLSGEDPVAMEEDVSWGQLFGFPESSWESSPEFRHVMEELIQATTTTGDWWNARVTLEWMTHHDAVPVRGGQRNPWGDLESTSTPEQFAREFGKRLDFDVPPIVHLSALSDSSSLLEKWGWEGRQRPQEHPLEVRAWTLRSDFTGAGVRGVTAALARSDLASLDFRLDDRHTEPQQLGVAVAKAGFLYSAMICGRSLCHLPDDDAGVIVRGGTLSDIRQMTSGASERSLAGFYSAMALSNVEHFSGGDYIREQEGEGDERAGLNPVLNRLQWQWLAYAFWSRISSNSVYTIDIAVPSLRAEDVAAVDTVLQNGYPEIISGQTVDSSEFGFVAGTKGTRLQPRTLADGDDAVLILSGEGVFRARWYASGQADVVVPGYGICTMALSEGVKSVRDAHLGTIFGRNQPRTWYLFKLFVEELESVEVLANLLAVVGKDLHTLWFGNTGADLHTIDLSALAEVCPKLEKLTLSDVQVVVTDDNAALRNWPLKTLNIDGVVSGLSTRLGDPTHRMARELVKLKVNVPRDWNFTDAEAFALEMHHGDFLSVVKTKFPIASKAALLSVWTNDSNVDETPSDDKALYHLDANTLALILGFAATPERRSVRVGTGRFSPVVFHEDQDD